jgi:hypothetical protein
VRFEIGGRTYMGASASLMGAMTAPQAAVEAADVLVQDDGGLIDNGQYVLTARLYNPGMDVVTVNRLVLTVFDDAQAVIGYRVVQTDDVIAPGKSLPIRVPIMVQTAPDAPTHSVYIEASPGE